MPRPHRPDEPLDLDSPLGVELLRRVREDMPMRDVLHQDADGRLIVRQGGTPFWVGLDLACACSLTSDRPCVHQVVAALHQGHPIAPPTADADADAHLPRRLATRVRDILARARPLELIPAAGPAALSRTLTDPALAARDWSSPAEAARLHAEVRSRTPAASSPLLAIAPGRRPGPLRRLAWADWLAGAETWAAYSATPHLRHALGGTLERWLRTASDAELPMLLHDLLEHPTTTGHLARVLALGDDLAPRLLARLDPPLRARLLARTTDRDLRLALGTLIGQA